MNIWANHKLSEREAITCPMCRRDWGPSALADLKRLMTEFQQRSKVNSRHDNTICANCLCHPIVGARYHCLVCDCADVCKRCWKSGAHKQHPAIKKGNPAEPWQPVIQNRDNRGLVDALQSREISPSDYEALLALDRPGISLYDYLSEILPSTDPGSECQYCHMPQSIPWKQLPCGHKVHGRCLHDLFQEDKNECAIDGRVIWLGYESSMV